MRIKRALLSVALLLLLTIVITGPNQIAYHAQVFAPYLKPFYTGLELGSPWSFYAPDPGGMPVRVEWELIDARGEVLRTGYLPESRSPYFLNERHLRRLVYARFLFGDDQKFLSVAPAWLCRENPDANSVRLWKAASAIPDFMKVRAGEATVLDMDFSERVAVGHAFCADFREGKASG